MIRGRCGVDLLEMSNALSVLLFVTFGMVEFGQYYNVKHCFEAAVRDGSRVATLPSASQAQTVATITTTLQQANVTFNASWLTVTDQTAVIGGSTAYVGFVGGSYANRTSSPGSSPSRHRVS